MTDEEIRQELRNRALGTQNSLLWTYKQYYLASEFYDYFSLLLDLLLALFGALLTYGTAWNTIDGRWMFMMAVATAGISLYKAIAKPGKRSEKYHNTGDRLRHLFVDFKDYIQLEVDAGADEKRLKEKFEELKQRKNELEEEKPRLRGIWYKYLKWRKEEEIYEQIETTEEEMRLLDGGDKKD